MADDTEERAVSTAPSKGLQGGETTPPPYPTAAATNGRVGPEASAIAATKGLQGGETTPPPDPTAAATNGRVGLEASAIALMKSPHPPEAEDHRFLHEYAGRYSGRALVGRLLFIASCSRTEAMELEALRMAFEEVRKGNDVRTYALICKEINGRFGPPCEDEWVDEVRESYNQSILFVEADIKTYRDNNMTAMIGKGYIDLGDLHYSHGYLSAAFEAYTHAQRYIASSSNNLAQLYFNAIIIDIELDNFRQVLHHVEMIFAMRNAHDAVTIAKLHAAAGIAYLRMSEYKNAALQFLEVGVELENNFSEIIAPQDVAIYGALCALATFNAFNIKTKVLDDTNFRYFLELVPDAWHMVNNFYHSQHTVFMEYLDKLMPSLLLDGHLSEHLQTLCIVITQKSEYVSSDVFLLDELCNAPSPSRNEGTSEADPSSPVLNVRSNIVLPDNFNDNLELPHSTHYKFLNCKDLLQSLGRSRKWVSKCQSCALLLNAELFVINSVNIEGKEKRVDGRIVLVSEEKFGLMEVEFSSYTTTGRTLKEKQLKDKEDSLIDRFEMKGDKWARRRICLRANPGFHLLQWRRTSALRRVQVQPQEVPEQNTKDLMTTLIEQLQSTSKTVTDLNQSLAKSSEVIAEACKAVVTAMRGGQVS